jgi:hypothetical protein
LRTVARDRRLAPTVNASLTGRTAVSELGVFTYCAAVGFVVAAVISTFYQWVTSESADFSISKAGVGGVVFCVLLTMFGGPFIVARKVVAGLRKREIGTLAAFVASLIVGMWSVCAGVFYVSLLVSA